MPNYQWRFHKRAAKEFAKLDLRTRRRILAWLQKNISGTDNPRLAGRALEGPLKTLWRYRVGKYRIIADINDGEFLVLVVKTDKREDVYRN